METKTLIDIFDAARLLSLTKRQVKLFVRDSQIPHIVLPNGEIRFDKDDLWAWASSMKREGQTDE